jgi:hypothetical protein
VATLFHVGVPNAHTPIALSSIVRIASIPAPKIGDPIEGQTEPSGQASLPQEDGSGVGRAGDPFDPVESPGSL